MASDELKNLIEDLNRNFETEKEDEEADDNNESFDEAEEIDLTGMDDEQILVESKKVSMFCRSCLSPYRGEQGQGGSLILKCSKCYHQDVVTETDLQEETLEYSDSLAKGGNIILNRFSKVLLERNELHNVDVDDPEYMDDDFKMLSGALSYITSITKKTFSDMYKITDDHRKVHNLEMVRMLTQQGQGEEVETDDGTTAMKFSVPIHGSKEDDDLIILPEQYKLPVEANESLKITGRKGIQKVDKYILNLGLDLKHIENMILFQKRLVCYCQLSEKSKLGKLKAEILHGETEIDENKSKVERSRCDFPKNVRNNDTLEKRDNLPDFQNLSLNTEKQALSEVPKQLPEIMKMTSNDASISPQVVKEEEDTTSKDHSPEICTLKHSGEENKTGFEKAGIATFNTEDFPMLEEASGKTDKIIDSVNSEKRIYDDETLQCSGDSAIGSEDDKICRPKIRSQLKNDMLSETTDDEKPDAAKYDYILPALLEFSKILHSKEEQKNLASSIPEDEVILEGLEPFTHVEVNEAFNELTSSMMHRANLAKEQRMLNTMAMIKRAASSMSEQVDRVQDDMLKELQIAYKSKRIKADKQKKHLQEAQNTLEHYRDLINHYQQTGQVDKLFEILDLLRDYNYEN